MITNQESLSSRVRKYIENSTTGRSAARLLGISPTQYGRLRRVVVLAYFENAPAEDIEYARELLRALDNNEITINKVGNLYHRKFVEKDKPSRKKKRNRKPTKEESIKDELALNKVLNGLDGIIYGLEMLHLKQTVLDNPPIDRVANARRSLEKIIKTWRSTSNEEK